MISRRAMVGGAIIAAWIAGLGVLVQREYFRPQLERLAEAATRVSPGAVYFAVLEKGKQVGFASSTIDTTEKAIGIVDYMAVDIPDGAASRRMTVRTNVTTTRGLRLSTFDFSIRGNGPSVFVSGRTDGDSILEYQFGKDSGSTPVRLPIDGPVLLPTMASLFVVLNSPAKTRNHYTFPFFAPMPAAQKAVSIRISAESVFVVNDSSVYDSTSARWHGVTPDSIHAWRLATTSDGEMGFNGWVDDQGRVLQMEQMHYTLRRMPYEVAFENWRADSGHVAVTDDRDILETTVIAANRRVDKHVTSLRVRLSGASLAGFDLNGQGQRVLGDTLVVTPAPDSALKADWKTIRRNNLGYTQAEPLIQSDSRQIRDLSAWIRNGYREPRELAERINTWVHDSIKPRITFGVPSALQIVKSRVGDCNEYTQLYVALARANGLPARAAAGLAYVDGKFYYHAWAEVFLGDWVAVDPTFGQFPADAARLRLTVGDLGRQAEIVRLIGSLKIDVLSVNGATVTK